MPRAILFQKWFSTARAIDTDLRELARERAGARLGLFDLPALRLEEREFFNDKLLVRPNPLYHHDD